MEDAVHSGEVEHCPPGASRYDGTTCHDIACGQHAMSGGMTPVCTTITRSWTRQTTPWRSIKSSGRSKPEAHEREVGRLIHAPGCIPSAGGRNTGRDEYPCWKWRYVEGRASNGSVETGMHLHEAGYRRCMAQRTSIAKRCHPWQAGVAVEETG
jgi:hypothetical protein